MNVHKHMEVIFVVALATVSLGSFALDDLPEVTATTPVMRAVAATPAPAGQALVMCAPKALPRRT
jgi:hypothetical protein